MVGEYFWMEHQGIKMGFGWGVALTLAVLFALVHLNIIHVAIII